MALWLAAVNAGGKGKDGREKKRMQPVLATFPKLNKRKPKIGEEKKGLREEDRHWWEGKMDCNRKYLQDLVLMWMRLFYLKNANKNGTISRGGETIPLRRSRYRRINYAL